MIRISIITILSLILISLITAQPKITVVQGTKFDFGDIYTGTKPIRIMTIKNTGNEVLNISQVTATCGCTAAMLSKNSLGPSDSGKLSITFNTANQNGRVNKHVFINSNDPKNPKVTIDFSANVINTLSLEPTLFSFNIIKPDSIYSQTMTLTNNTKEPIKILGVETKFERLKVSLMKNQLLPGEQTELLAILQPDKPGTFNGTIDLKINHPLQPKIEIRVFEWYNKR